MFVHALQWELCLSCMCTTYNPVSWHSSLESKTVLIALVDDLIVKREKNVLLLILHDSCVIFDIEIVLLKCLENWRGSFHFKHTERVTSGRLIHLCEY